MSVQILFYLAPALLLLAALVCGYYPGERLLDALVRGWSPVVHQPEPAARRLLPIRSFPRGGALLAMALAGRGPPGWVPPRSRRSARREMR